MTLVPDMKPCPRCAEDVRAAAIVCRYCGYEFTPDGVSAMPRTRAPQTSALAVWAFTLSLLWLAGVGAALGVVLGLQAREKIAASGGRLTGDGLALAGVVIGVIGILSLAAVVFAVVV